MLGQLCTLSKHFLKMAQLQSSTVIVSLLQTLSLEMQAHWAHGLGCSKLLALEGTQKQNCCLVCMSIVLSTLADSYGLEHISLTRSLFQHQHDKNQAKPKLVQTKGSSCAWSCLRCGKSWQYIESIGQCLLERPSHLTCGPWISLDHFAQGMAPTRC